MYRCDNNLPTNVAGGQTDGHTTYDINTALRPNAQ